MPEQIFETDELKCRMEEKKHLGDDKHFLTFEISKDVSEPVELNLKVVLDSLILIGADKANSTSGNTIQLNYEVAKDQEREFNFLVEENGLKNQLKIDGVINNEELSKEVEI